MMKGLYIHIPFCESICHYCDFVKRKPKDDQMIDAYLDTLEKEIASYRSHFSSIETIYIGGGTPSMLSVSQLKRLFEMIKEIHPREYTIEVNPESYDPKKGDLMVKYRLVQHGEIDGLVDDTLARQANVENIKGVESILSH